MYNKLVWDLLEHEQSLSDTFKLDCSKEDLKNNKEAKRCYKQLKQFRKHTMKYCDFLCKKEVAGMRNREPNRRLELIGVLLYILSLVTILCCAVAAVVFSIQNPDMTEMRQLIEYPQPAIISLIALVVGVIGRAMLK